MTTHELKILPQFFEAVLSGEKTFEYRKNDRFFQKGDTVILKEWSPETRKKMEYGGGMPLGEYTEVKGYTGRTLEFKIGWLCPVDAEHVCFSLVKCA